MRKGPGQGRRLIEPFSLEQALDEMQGRERQLRLLDAENSTEHRVMAEIACATHARVFDQDGTMHMRHVGRRCA